MSELPSSLPDIDVASGLARVAGNKNLYLKLLRLVARDAQANLDKLHEAVAAGNAQGVREVAHSLKGAAGNLSITKVAEVAERLEAAAKAEDFAAIAANIEVLDKTFAEYTATVDSLAGL